MESEPDTHQRLAQMEQTGSGTFGDEGSGEDSSTGGSMSGGSMSGGSMSGGSMSGGSMTGGPMTGGPMTGGSMTGGPMTGDPTTGDPTTGDPTTGDPTTGDPMTGGPMTGGEESEEACLEAERVLPAVPSACNSLNTIEDLMACKRAMNVDLTTFLAALIRASKLPAGSEATCSGSSAQPASCGSPYSPDDLRVFITSGNLILSVTLTGDRIEVGQKGIAGYPESYMIMADIHFGEPGTSWSEEAYYNAYPPGDPSGGCASCHEVDPMYSTPERTITYIEPGGPEHTVEVRVLPRIELDDGSHGGNTSGNLRDPATLFGIVCVGSNRSSDYCNRLGAVLGHALIECADAAECNEDFVCDPGECKADCPNDCVEICGNSICEELETIESCAYDCDPPL